MTYSGRGGRGPSNKRISLLAIFTKKSISVVLEATAISEVVSSFIDFLIKIFMEQYCIPQFPLSEKKIFA